MMRGGVKKLDETVLHGLKITAVVGFYFIVSISLVFLNKFILKVRFFVFVVVVFFARANLALCRIMTFRTQSS